MFFIPSYSILYAKEKGVKNLLLLWLYIGTGMLITSLPVWILHPAWLPDFIANLQQNPDWMQPNLYALFSQYLRNFQTPVMVIFFISGMAINLLLPFWLPKKPALLWSLALTTIFSLYLWSWDFVLLYPLFIYSFSSHRHQLPRIILLVGWSICIATTSIYTLMGYLSDQYNVWIPFFILAIILVSNFFTRHMDTREKLTNQNFIG